MTSRPGGATLSIYSRQDAALMLKRPGNPDVRHDIECEVDGQLHPGTWELGGGMVTVKTIYGTRSAVPGSSPAVIAEAR